MEGARPPGGWEGTRPRFHLLYVTAHRLSTLEAAPANLLAIYLAVLASSPRLLSVEYFSRDGWVLPGQRDASELERRPAGSTSDCQDDLLLSRRAEPSGDEWRGRRRVRKGTGFCTQDPGPCWAWRRDFPGCMGGTGRTSPLSFPQ